MSRAVEGDLRLVNESIRSTEPQWSPDATSFEEVTGHLQRAIPGALELLRRKGEVTPRSLAARIRAETGGGPDWPGQVNRAATDGPSLRPDSPPPSPWGLDR
jgi:hypothetical protein